MIIHLCHLRTNLFFEYLLFCIVFHRYHPLKLTIHTWKCMVGRQAFLLGYGWPIFRCFAVSFTNDTWYIYIYMVTPPPHDPPTSILYGNYQCFMHIFCTRKMTFSCFYFFYLLRKSPTQTHTHTHMQFCFCLLFCHFLRFWSKTQKTLRKPKKPKKPKLQDPCRYKLVS